MSCVDEDEVKRQIEWMRRLEENAERFERAIAALEARVERLESPPKK
jgi:hypothetical protein